MNTPYPFIKFNERRVTNAFVEGANSAIRKIEAVGAGYDFDVLRAKVMMREIKRIVLLSKTPPGLTGGVFVLNILSEARGWENYVKTL